MPQLNSVLVANRGEVARRVLRACRARGLATVAVFSDADEASPHVREADTAVRLPGSTPAETYLRGDLLVAAALAAGADAVHPGYGFLAEDPGFARAVLTAGLTWIGPPPAAMEAMASKLRAKALMAAAGVPVLPGRDVTDLDEAALHGAAGEIGYPVLVKASAGGGGRGMRVVPGPDDLLGAVKSAQHEALSAFGDGTVFLERYVERPRHIEVQVVADTHGQVVALFERDCSVQRRHQKVVEEAPSPAVSPELRARLTEAALTATRAVDYAGVGTVEFVLDRGGSFAFLEMNTRLQVEHPVTELVTGLDLVALQLLVAAGEPLPPEVAAATITGHAIEVRLYAEDPVAGFLPTSGTLHRFALPDTVRVEAGVETGSVVSTFYDGLLAKLIAHAPTRDQAARLLADALQRSQIHGVLTNRDLLVRLLRSPEFRRGAVDPSFLERSDLAGLGRPLAEDRACRLHAVAATVAQASTRPGAGHWADKFPPGWRNVPSQLETTSYDGIVVAHAFRRGGLIIEVDGVRWESLRLLAASATEVDLEVDGLRRRYAVHRVGATSYVDSALGSTAMSEDERFVLPGSQLSAGSLQAPMPGTVLTVAVRLGDAVTAGQVLVVLEAMKMEHPVRATAAGQVTELYARVGAQVDAGSVLAVVG